MAPIKPQRKDTKDPVASQDTEVKSPVETKSRRPFQTKATKKPIENKGGGGGEDKTPSPHKKAPASPAAAARKSEAAAESPHKAICYESESDESDFEFHERPKGRKSGCGAGEGPKKRGRSGKARKEEQENTVVKKPKGGSREASTIKTPAAKPAEEARGGDKTPQSGAASPLASQEEAKPEASSGKGKGGKGGKGKKGKKGGKGGKDAEEGGEEGANEGGEKEEKKEEPMSEFDKIMQRMKESQARKAELEADRAALEEEEKQKAAVVEVVSQEDKSPKKSSQPAVKQGPLSRKDKKEATAKWMEVYQEKGGDEWNRVFNKAKDLLMQELAKRHIDVHALQRQTKGYSDALTDLMVEKKLGFKELHESEKQKVKNVAIEYYNRRRREFS